MRAPMRPELGGLRGAAGISGKENAAFIAQKRHPAQHRCKSCGAAGRPSLADPANDDPRPVLRLSWPGGGKPVLLCARCRSEVAS